MIRTLQDNTIIKAVGLTTVSDESLLGYSTTTDGWPGGYYIHEEHTWHPMPDNSRESL